MSTGFVENAIRAGVPWIRARGMATDAFRALGKHAANEIKAVLAEIPDLPRLRARLVGEPATAQLYALVADASRTAHPRAWRELEALADGAGVPFDDLVLLNLRGDLGLGAGAGCSDLAWTDGEQAYIAHNEDDYPLLGDYCRLLTLELDGDPPVDSWWIPGFIPSNTWAATGRGLVYTIDHLNVVAPSVAAGRSFVAREMQRAGSVADAVEWLRGHAGAGGFTYTIGCIGSGAITVVEAAAGEVATYDVRPDDEPRWHTNHIRYLDEALDAPQAESKRRGEILGAAARDAAPGVDWFTSILRTPLPEGVFRDGSEGDALATHCTLVVDLATGDLDITTHRGSARVRPTQSSSRQEELSEQHI